MGLAISVTLALALISSAAMAADAVPAGQSLFASKKCSSCHDVARPPKNYSPAEQIKGKGPALWYAGSKFKDGFLKAWLRDPKPIRPMEYNSVTEKNRGNHPALNDREAGEVAAYLMTFKSNEAAAFTPAGNRELKGRFVFQKKLGCYGCHATLKGGKLTGGLTGPALVGVKSRLRPEWVYSFMTNQRAFAPASPMPVYSGLADDEEMKALAEFVSGLE